MRSGRDGRIGFFMLELERPEVRGMSARELTQRWRDKVGQVEMTPIQRKTAIKSESSLRFNKVAHITKGTLARAIDIKRV